MANLVEFLYRALDAEFGIVVRCRNPERLRHKLYTARREAKNPDFERISFLLSRTNPSTELWIVKNSSDTEPSDAPQKV